MAAQFPGSNGAEPSVYVSVKTVASGLSSPSGVQTLAIMGEGQRFETLVSQALGGGSDGFNPEYTSTSVDTDGRHFKTSLYPIISNRFTVAKSGVTLAGLEQAFDSDSGSFSSRYDYRVDIETGHLELQTASLVDLGGAFYLASSLNTGDGYISNLTLSDLNAPTETWTIKCTSVRRDGYGDVIPGFAQFVAQGTVSGSPLDGYGNVVTWKSDGVAVSNEILSFAINEGTTYFIEGDKFTLKVKGGALLKGQSLTISYIAESDLNTPVFFTNNDKLQIKHGSPSITNRLSLGAQIAFANSPPGVFALQTKPAVPRRVSYELEDSASGNDQDDDLNFPLPLGVLPDADSNVHFFLTSASTGVETQIFPNKVDFYDPTYSSNPSAFIQSTSLEYSYTVIQTDAVAKSADDGVIASVGPSSATLDSSVVLFDANDVGRSVKILEPASNAGTYTIASVSNGIATISSGSFTDESGVEFEVIDDTETSCRVLMTQDLAPAAGASLRVTLVDDKDADFYDAGWADAFEALEKIDVDIVIPLPSQTISGILQACKAHCEAMSTSLNKKERRMYTGAIAGLTPDNLLGREDAAVEDLGILEGIQGDSINEILDGNVEDLTNYSVPDGWGDTFRAVYFYPDEVVVNIAGENTLVDGLFSACAAAGWVAALPNPAVPMTNKTFTGITILSDKLLTPQVRRDLLAAGVNVLVPVAGGVECLWGKTTTQSGAAEEEEDSIVAIRDIVARAARVALKPYIGMPESRGIKGTLQAKFDKFLKGLVSAGFISSYDSPKVSQNEIEPRQWDFTARIRPRYPINWIYVEFELGNF